MNVSLITTLRVKQPERNDNKQNYFIPNAIQKLDVNGG